MKEMYEVIGIGPMKSGTNKAGNAWTGFNLYCTTTARDVAGRMCFNLWVPGSVEVGPELVVGSVVCANFNRYGSLIEIEVVG